MLKCFLKSCAVISLSLLLAGNCWAGVDFDGTDDRVDIAGVFDFAGQAITISERINSDVDNANQYMFTQHQSGDAALGGVIFWLRATGAIAFTGLFATSNVFRQSENGVISAGTDYHVLVTGDGSVNSSGIHIYVNNSEVSYNVGETIEGSGAAVAGDGSSSIGGRITDDNRNFNGEITEAHCFNRVVNADERANLFGARLKGLGVGFSDNKGSWLLDDHPVGTNLAGTIYRDFSTNGNDGTGDDDDTSGGQQTAETILSYPSQILGGL